MKTVGSRILLFAGAFLIYAMINNEESLKWVSGAFALFGLGLIVFGPKK